MSARLYVHFGPPKTATTSLQIALQEAKLNCLRYGGAFQPRENNAGSLAQRLHHAVAGKCSTDDPETQNALKEIRSHLAGDRSVLVSEEMFLVTQRDCPFERKIERLARLLDRIPTSAILTLRDPREGLPSLYQELFAHLPLFEQLSFARFARGKRARCYDYRFVIDVLERSGFDDIQFLDFEKLSQGKFAISDVLRGAETTERVLQLGRANAGRQPGMDASCPA